MGEGGPRGRGEVSREPAPPAAGGVAELVAESEPAVPLWKTGWCGSPSGSPHPQLCESEDCNFSGGGRGGKGRSGVYWRSKTVFLFSEAKWEETESGLDVWPLEINLLYPIANPNVRKEPPRTPTFPSSTRFLPDFSLPLGTELRICYRVKTCENGPFSGRVGFASGSCHFCRLFQTQNVITTEVLRVEIATDDRCKDLTCPCSQGIPGLIA